jgi:DNA gyrase subunit A
MRLPLIDGQGNFGSIDGDNPAAMRYTEARLTALAEAMMRDLDQGTVDWLDNFDGSLKEPEILPTVVPNLLVNGSSGVAVGMATHIPPHNLGEVCDGLIYLAGRWPERDEVSVDDLMALIPGPDFPTGGVIYRYRPDEEGDIIRQAYTTGRGRIVCLARLDILDARGGKADIVVTQLPYLVQKSTLLERIGKEVRDGRLSGITDVRDESDYEGLRVVIEVSRMANPREVLEGLLSRTQLRETFGVNALALIKGEGGEVEPHYLSLKAMLIHFISHRLTVIERRSRFELDKCEARRHIVEGLLKALDQIDEIITTIKKSQDAETAQASLMKKFKLSQLQAQAILAMQLRRLAALEQQKLEDEQTELTVRIAYLQGLLDSETKRLEVIVDETTALKAQFASPRRTLILDTESQEPVTEADLVMPTEPQMVVLTSRGVLRADHSGFGYSVKDGVTARAVEAYLVGQVAQPEQTVVFISDQGRLWHVPVGSVPLGAPFADLGLGKAEMIVGLGVVVPEQTLIIGTRRGNIKRVRTQDLSVGSSWSTIIGLDQDNGDNVLFAGIAPNEAEIIFYTASGKLIRFQATQVKDQATPSARGVTGIKLRKGDQLSGGTICLPADVHYIVVVSENGFIKKVPLDEFPVQGRAGQGVLSWNITKATGRVAVATTAGEKGKIDVLSAKGRRLRLDLAAIPEANRSNRGEKLIDFGADDVIAAAVFW